MSNQTVYVRNLSEKVKPDALKRALYLSFSAFGNIIEIHAPRTKRIRGQAWIVYDDTTGAVQAVTNMNGKVFYNKPIEVAFAREKSDIVAKYEGTYVPKKDRQSDVKAEHKEDTTQLLGVKRGLQNASEEQADIKSVKRENNESSEASAQDGRNPNSSMTTSERAVQE